MSSHNEYVSALSTRYASAEMSYLFSEQKKYSTWRSLWVALAKVQKKLGLKITDEQIAEMESAIHKIDFSLASEMETLTRHDVMAHILAFGKQCPKAKGIIHLGATSTFLTDNGDLVQIRDALGLLQKKFITLVRILAGVASKYAGVPTLGWTHFQPAQPVTVGKRIALWLQDFLYDFHDLNRMIDSLQFLGAKGATGTQASFLELFDGNSAKVVQLEQLIASDMGFKSLFPLASQTYTRKQDVRLLAVLKGLATSAHKFGTDLRLLAHVGEVFEERLVTQIGSSAMPHKRNPARSERLCGIARYLISLDENAAYTHATQWLERSLDDSANRRLYLPEAFLAADSLLELLIAISKSLTINSEKIAENLEEQISFLSLETILMKAVKAGGDRQQTHALLKQYAFESAGNGKKLVEKLSKDRALAIYGDDFFDSVDSNHLIGMAKTQVEAFLKSEIQPVFDRFSEIPDSTPSVNI